MTIGRPAVLWAGLAAAALLLVRSRVADRTPRPPETIVLAAAQSGAMALESEPTVIRFGTPAAEAHESHGFERSRPDPAAEPSSGMRRRAEMRLRWSAPASRAGILDLDVPLKSPYRALRVLLNGHKVGRLELFPGRRRYAFDLPAERQQKGGNALSLIFGAEAAPDRARPEVAQPGQRVAARVFGLAVGAPSPAMDAIARAPLPFSAWAEGNDVVQAGPSRLAWAIASPATARLRFVTSGRHGAPSFRIESENHRGERSEVWRGGSGREATVDVPGQPGDLLRMWLHVESADGKPSWGVWKGLALTGSASPPPAAPVVPPILAASRPRLASSSVLVVVLDAAGARHFGCYGYARRTTPNIDRIAAEGILFDRAYTPAVFTRSAMASMWTSQLPDEHHAASSYDEPLPAGVPTLAGIVSAAGLATAGFVGNPMAGTAFGLDRGFAEFYHRTHRAEALRESFQGWLSRKARRRFLAYVHFREPHYPFDPRPPFDTLFGPDAPLPASAKTDSGWLDRVNDGSHRPSAEEIEHLQRLYDGNLAAVDHEVGLLRKHLEGLGIWDRTVLVITADHGEAIYEHGHIGHTWQVHEDSVRIPLILRFPPGTVPGGRRVDSLTSLLDVAPTIADVLGIPKERMPTFRGRSLLPVATGGSDSPPEAVLCRTAGSQPSYAWVGARYKFLINQRDGDERMFDPVHDPGERTDLLQSEPVQAAYCRQRLFSALLALPGRSGPSASGWKVPADQRESLRALGYVQ
jgi:arylsulfatase A-like enzyme